MMKRDYSIDLLRIVAAAMVVMIHCSGWFSFVSKEPVRDIDTLVFGNAVSCAVPLFFMISGSLLLSPQYDFSLKKILYKIGKIIIILVAWGGLYAVSQIESFSFEKLLIWTFKGHFHFWFFDYLIGVYLLTPVFRALVLYEKGKYVKWFLGCWLLFGIIKYTVNGIQPHNEEIRIVTSKMTFELCNFSGYFVLGYYLSTIKEEIQKGFLLLAFLSCVVFCTLFISGNKDYQVSTMSFTLPVVIESVTLFLLFYQMRLSEQNSSWLIPVSSATLGIYLIHPLILEHFLIPGVLELYPWIRVLCLWGYVFFFSLMASLLLNRIPFIRKWLLSI